MKSEIKIRDQDMGGNVTACLSLSSLKTTSASPFLPCAITCLLQMVFTCPYLDLLLISSLFQVYCIIQHCGGYGPSEHFIWEGHHLIIIVGAIIMVWSSRECVCPVTSTRYVLQLMVEVFQEADVSGHSPVYFLGVPIILQVCMIYIHLPRTLHSHQQVPPYLEGYNDC